jgi:hypothetical protein
MTDETTPLSPEQSASLVSKWMKEYDAAKKREKTFRAASAKIVQLYEGDEKTESQFNILYSNTETLAPALYNSIPRAVVDRRFKDEDKIGGMAAKITQRTLEYLLDDGMAEYASFDDLMKSAVLEALVPGRGLTRFKYDASIKTEEAANPTDDADSPPPVETVEGEVVCGEEVPWDRFCHGYAKKWKDVPWVAFDHFMDKGELVSNFGEIGNLVPVAESASEDDESGKSDEGLKDTKTAAVIEIWDKQTKKVYFFARSYPDAPVKVVDDPLGLTGFFPNPKPLTFTQKISTLTPVPLYTFYEEQAKELNAITLRINRLIRALKVRGLYDATVEGLDKVLSADDNVLIPAENVAALQQGQSLEKAIWLFPIEKLIVVLQQLYLQRNQVKQVIYEITGIADIMRGSSSASETLGAQEIKNQWGTLRLKRSQKEVGRYARDCLRIMAEIAVSKFSEVTLKGMTGLQIPSGEEKAQAQQILAAGPPMGADPNMQPPPELLELAQGPSFTELLDLLRTDTNRSYRIDIETNSTIDAEATEDKQNVGELLNALAQYLNGIQPLVESGSLPFEAAQGMMLAIVRRFRFGPELEDQLKKMKAPTPPADPNEAKNAQAMELGKLDMQAKQMDNQMKQAQMAQQAQIAQMQLQIAQQEHQMKMAELQQKGQLAIAAHQQKMEAISLQAAAARQTAQITAAKPAPAKSV